MDNIKNLIFDADDTLWENNIFFVKTTDRIINFLSQYGFEKKYIENIFLEIEKQVVFEFGYGSQNYISILKQLIDFFENKHGIKIDVHEFDKIIDQFYEHKRDRPKLFPNTISILEYLHKKYSLYILTKGQLEEQEEKILRSGLANYFNKYFILAEKDDSVYLDLVKKQKWNVAQTAMIGNSPKSDINPALRAGMFAIFIPYKHTWNMDNEDILKDHPRLKIINSIDDIKNIL